MIYYGSEIRKNYKKGKIPKNIFDQFHNVFQALDLTKDLSIFDIKMLKKSSEDSYDYYRVRKGKYRAIFYIENGDFFVISLAKRDEVYKKWQ